MAHLLMLVPDFLIKDILMLKLNSQPVNMKFLLQDIGNQENMITI